MLLWLGIALVVLLADQITKLLIVDSFAWGDSQPITAYFNLVRVHNSGAAFSMLSSASERCWHYRADVGHDAAHAALCGRCTRNLFGAGETRLVA